MRLFIPISLACGILGCLATACGNTNADLANSSGSQGAYDSSGGFGMGGGDSGVDVDVGDDGGTTESFSYAEYCGTGCVPGTGRASREGCNQGAGGSGDGGVLDCQLVVDFAGEVSGVCGATNDGTDGTPCLSTAHCAPGFACVGDMTGTCRAYCCGDVEDCDEGTYCALLELSAQDVANVDDPPLIPACELADNCKLLTDNQCESPLVCTVVRTDGTTSCIEEGAGVMGESCPCKEGFMCNTALNECQQLCSMAGNDCPEGYFCQSSSNVPDSFGICDTY